MNKIIKTNLLAILLILSSTATYADCVILLHGLARSDKSMLTLEKALTKAHYQVVNTSYSSREYPIPELAQQSIPTAIDKCSKDSDIHFVTHSMGGILLRYYLSEHKLTQLKRVVMLGPPNQGSEVIDKLGEFPGFHFLNGDAGLQLGTGKASLPLQLGKVEFDLGVIAGKRSINWILSGLIPGRDDGKVSVERTKVEGMKEHLVMPVTHTFMMNNTRVIEQVIHYLKNGQFKPSINKHSYLPSVDSPYK